MEKSLTKSVDILSKDDEIILIIIFMLVFEKCCGYTKSSSKANFSGYNTSFEVTGSNPRQNHKSFLIRKVGQRSVAADENLAIILNYFQSHHEELIREASGDLNLKYSVI